VLLFVVFTSFAATKNKAGIDWRPPSLSFAGGWCVDGGETTTTDPTIRHLAKSENKDKMEMVTSLRNPSINGRRLYYCTARKDTVGML